MLSNTAEVRTAQPSPSVPRDREVIRRCVKRKSGKDEFQKESVGKGKLGAKKQKLVNDALTKV